ncbi:Acg family FMN-binding oxidoreductase [Neogemmobacter tilapiae]|uniref:Twin-arginine translocation pathway signal protein n=1 Tax=Neogemmobacter tilapiae TaxID=875041 RepID=A0A918WLK1_9RHOB|nr:twin-arginine translocation pathway signal protein [Gemmobacter tilapiae]GHC54285.1 hypothetical protein GCM10007315_16440 [Gemmobacter tilapiae]
MSLSRRKSLFILGGGVILAATAVGAKVAMRAPQTALLPWGQAGQGDDPRIRALSYALLAPNPHNRQPWLVDLATPNEITLFADLNRLLPETDPMNRQITVGLGAFLGLLRMAALQDGLRAEITPFPMGETPEGLDARPIAHIRLTPDSKALPDPLFAQVLARRSVKEPYDLTRPVPSALLEPMAKAVIFSDFGASVDPAHVQSLREFTHNALAIEVATPRTYAESVNLFRIGAKETDANPDGIDFGGPLFEMLAATGQFTRETALDTTSTVYQQGMAAVFANCDTAMGHVWLVTPANDRASQLAVGEDWLRLHLAATAAGLSLQPLSQALQEFPEMAGPYRDIHARLAPNGGTVQMLGRIGFGPEVGPSPRWPLETRIANGAG